MDIARIVVVREWIASWKALAQHGLYVVASGLMDFLFLFSFGFLTRPVFDKLTEHVIIIGTLVSEQMRVPAGRVRPAVIDALFLDPARGYTLQFLGLLVVLAVVVFVLFCVFQGLAWWFATSVAGKKTHWRVFLLQFARINMFWFGLYAVWYVVDAILDLRRLVVEKALGQSALASNTVLLVVLVVLVYLAMLSYPLLGIRKAVLLGTHRAQTMLPAFILIVVQMLAGNFLVQWVAQVSKLALFILGTVLLVVLLAWSRLYLARLVRTVKLV